MTWWTGNVSIVLLAAISLVIVGYRLWRQRKRRLAAKANVDDYKNAWGHFMQGGRWLHQKHCMTLFDARMLLYPVHQGSSDSAWNWVRACLPAEVTIPMNAPTPAELERVIRSDARARRALIAQRMNDEEGRTFFPFQMLASMAMTSAGLGAPDRSWLHGAVGRPWLVEDDNVRTKDVILQDIGLRCHALELALAVEENMHGEAVDGAEVVADPGAGAQAGAGAEAGKVSDPTSKAIWVEHIHGNC
ncbi:hypothetical protein [Stenotrophomonas sp. CFBP 13725]|uniref:hypothetical protein n=1 Tax=Stenotrophomonas sp. CFBP 13725 TaxID=2775297 RepID=UPI00177FBA79|nr:hypothetical protein [Stenotrophomonas sp. CFBP 13725]MBD8636611.1 hypothetical protein [Stenotrophomonas sp. CFBP 13725]